MTTRRQALLSLAALAGAAVLSPSVLAAEDLIKWRSLAVGEAESKKTAKPVLYFLTAEWCGPCHTLRNAVFSDPSVADLIHKEFIPVEVVDRTREEGRNLPEVSAVFTKFRLQGFPTLAISRPGSAITLVRPGWSNKQQTIAFLEGAKASLTEREQIGRTS